MAPQLAGSTADANHDCARAVTARGERTEHVTVEVARRVPPGGAGVDPGSADQRATFGAPEEPAVLTQDEG